MDKRNSRFRKIAIHVLLTSYILHRYSNKYRYKNKNSFLSDKVCETIEFQLMLHDDLPKEDLKAFYLGLQKGMFCKQ